MAWADGHPGTYLKPQRAANAASVSGAAVKGPDSLPPGPFA